MTTPQPIKLDEWIIGQYTAEGRGEFVRQIAPIFEQQEPVRVTRRFKLYRAEDSAVVETYRNEDTGEEYDYASYVYTAPVVRGIVGARFPLEQSIRLSERSFVDIFRKP